MGKERLETGRGRGSGVVKNSGARKQVQAAKQGGGKRWFYILLAVLLIVGIATLSYLAARPKGVSQVANTTPIPNQGHVIGSDSALVEVVEFADFECPACGAFANLTEPDVRTRLVNTGQIRFRFLDYPLPMHRNTWSAHGAAWCAAEQGKFWEMHDVIFQNQDRWNAETTRRPDRVLSDLARGVGLDMARYEQCVGAQKYRPQIQANLNEANRRGIPSTPTFIIGTKQVSNNLSYDQFKRYVDEALGAARARTKAPQPAR
jgi:protein-disulfide isomerase